MTEHQAGIFLPLEFQLGRTSCRTLCFLWGFWFQDYFFFVVLQKINFMDYILDGLLLM